MSTPDQQKWNRIYRDAPAKSPQPARVLLDYAHLLPDHGVALDLACGRGGNALFLAHHGLETHAWDLSSEVLQRLQHDFPGAGLHTRCFNTESESLPKARFDVITVSRFLQRSLFPALIAALKPGGLIFYQTFTVDKSPEVGPKREAFVLQRNELLKLFQALDILAYREEGRVGQLDQGFRNEAMLVARNPGPLPNPVLG